MTKGLNFPTLQPHRFVDVDYVLPAKYHYYDFNSVWFQKAILYYEKHNEFRDDSNTRYYTLMQNDGIVTMMYEFITATTTSVQLQIMSCSGALTNVSFSFLKTAIRAGNVYDAHGTTDPQPLSYHQWEFPVSTYLPTQQGKYFLLLTVQFTDSTTKQYISEPISVKKNHKHTLLWQYTNNQNQNDIFFDLNPKMELRLQGSIEYDAPQIDMEAYQKEDLGTETLSLKAWDGLNCIVGNRNGIAPYHIKKLPLIMGCSSVKIEGKQYALANDAQFKVTKFAYYPLRTVIFPIVESHPEDAGNKYSGSTIKIFPVSGAGGSFPYGIDELRIKDIAGPAFSLIGNAMEVMNVTEENALPANLGALLPALGLAGTYSISDGYFVYNNAEGESYTLDYSKVYKTWQKIRMTGVSAPSLVFNLSFSGNSSMRTVVSCRTSAGAISTAAARFIGNASPAFTITAALYDVYIYTDDNMTTLNMSALNNPKVTGITGDCSGILKTFVLSYATPAFTMAWLNRAKLTLEMMLIEDCQFSSFDVSAFSIVPLDPSWRNIDYISFKRCNLTAAQQDTFYNTFFSVANFSTTVGTLTTQSQSPSSAPTGTSATFRGLMTSGGWTILF